MSNQLHIKRQQTFDCEGSDYGYRIYDNYDKDYQNGFESQIYDDMELLQDAVTTFPDFFDLIGITKTGVYIDNEYYEYEQIKQYVG